MLKQTIAKRCILLLILFMAILEVNGQQTDTLKEDRFSIHAQTTVIAQLKPAFTAEYTGANSLVPQKESVLSLTYTLFLGVRLWKGASIFINPEVAGGSGLSGSLGVGASSNGETYRVANPVPSFDFARLFMMQIIPLTRDRGPVNVFPLRAHLVI
jgi:high affinity Mn2+ porin